MQFNFRQALFWFTQVGEPTGDGYRVQKGEPRCRGQAEDPALPGLEDMYIYIYIDKQICS